jgi:hypothetical protein
MNGNPVSIVIGSFDIITIYATVFAHWDVNGYDLEYGTQGHIYVASEHRSRFFSNQLLGDYSSTAGTIYGLRFDSGNIPINTRSTLSEGNKPLGTTAPITTIYDSINKKIKLSSAYRLPSTLGNFSGLRLVTLLSTGGTTSTSWSDVTIVFKVGGDWFPKTSIIGESIGTGDGVQTEFGTDFPFVLPGSTIYVDGVAQTSGVEVIEGLPSLTPTDVQKWFKVLNISSGVVGTVFLEEETSFSSWIEVENLYSEKGILSFLISRGAVRAKNNLEDAWIEVALNTSNSATITIASTYRNYKYWRLEANGNDGLFSAVTSATPETWFTHNIKFDTPPALGAVITADYDTETIAKDANHVFDFNFEITLGEKV